MPFLLEIGGCAKFVLILCAQPDQWIHSLGSFMLNLPPVDYRYPRRLGAELRSPIYGSEPASGWATGWCIAAS